MTALLKVNCQTVYGSYLTGFTTTEFWVGTPYHSGNPGVAEWVEVGIVSGNLQGTGVQQAFFWARAWWDSVNSTWRYQEFRIGTATASSGINYEWTIKYVPGSGSGTGWRIFSPSGDHGGGSANRPPGSYQWVEMGGESTRPLDGQVGAVSNEYRISNGTTVYGLTGHIFYDTNAYSFTTTSSRNISFRTPFANDSGCR